MVADEKKRSKLKFAFLKELVKTADALLKPPVAGTSTVICWLEATEKARKSKIHEWFQVSGATDQQSNAPNESEVAENVGIRQASNASVESSAADFYNVPG